MTYYLGRPDNDEVIDELFMARLMDGGTLTSHGLETFSMMEDLTQVLAKHVRAGYVLTTKFTSDLPNESTGLLIEVTRKEEPPFQIMFTHRPHYLYVQVAAQLRRQVNTYLEWLKGALTPIPPIEPNDDSIHIRFLYRAPMGPEELSRTLTAPTWQQVEKNYAQVARQELEPLMGKQLDTLSGKFGVLHGPPGTGKTHVLRALMQAWRKQAAYTYVVDPEIFFNDAGYMMQVIYRAAQREQRQWRVIICEDAEEFIAADAKKDVGEAVARLLNLGDGLLGQGLRLLFLFTTNKAGVELHPAMTRAGRCFANIEVPELPAAEASTWLGQEVKGKMSLADLYEARGKQAKVQVASAN